MFSSTKKSLFFNLLLLAFTMSAFDVAHAQQATITGRATDQAGAIVPGAQVTVANVETSIKVTVTTNEEGVYTIPLLQPGNYQVAVEAGGFKSIVRSGVKLDVQQVARLDFAMEPGGVTETVQVTDNAQLTDPETSSLGQVIDNKRVLDLPLNGRNPLELMRLSTGVRLLSSSFNDVRGFNLSSASINGGQGGSNAILVDGANATLSFDNGQYVVAPNVDAVQEFKVQTNSFAAEFGLTGGGVINLVTKSGNNKLQGSLFEFLRNDALDANSWTNNRVGRDKSPLRYNQFGGTLSGPVFLPRIGSGGPRLIDGRNRSFFLFNYEGFRFRSAVTNLLRVPTELERQGDFRQTFVLDSRTRQFVPVRLFDPNSTRRNPSGSGNIRDGFATSVIPTNRIDPVALRALQFYPLPNRTPEDLTGRNNFVSTPGTFTDSAQYSVRLDHQINEKNKLFGRYTQNDSTATILEPTFGRDNIADPNNAEQERLSKNVVLSDTHIFSANLFNDFRFSVSRQSLVGNPPGLGKDAPRLLGLPATIPSFVFPRFNIGEVTPLGNITGQLAIITNTSGQIANNLSILFGKHNIKVGADLRTNFRNTFQPGASSGQFEFPRTLTNNPQDPSGPAGFGLATFLLGAVNGGSLDNAISNAVNFRYYAGFIQDDFKVNRRLTLNLGLRYDLITPTTERFDRFSNFNPEAINPVTGRPGVVEFAGVDLGRTVTTTDKNDFGPRAGFALDVFGDARTIIRGGFGIFYYTGGQLQIPSSLGFGASTSFQSPRAGSPSFQLANGPDRINQPIGTSLGARSLLGESVVITEPDTRTSYVQQWNLGVQRELPGDLLLDVAYAGSHGVKQLTNNYDLNQLDPRFLSLGLALDESVPNPFFGIIPAGTPFGGATITRRQSLRPYPAFGNIDVRSPNLGNTIYHSAQAKIEKRFSQGLSFLGAYTFSKQIGDVERQITSNQAAPQSGVNCGQSTKYDRRACRSILPQDITHLLTVSYVYELPVGQGKQFLSEDGVLGKILGGFQINGITTLRSGLPLIVRGASNGAADRPNIIRSARLSRDERSPDRWFDTTAFAAPAPFTFGNVPRALSDARGPGFASFDFSLVKNIRLMERARLQLRAETFNLFNHVNFDQPNVNFLSGGFGTITGAGEPRRVQLALRLDF